MMKKLVALLLVMLLGLGLLAPAALAAGSDYGENDYQDPGYYYVYTENGKVLNVRDSPNGKVVGALKYGARIHVDALVDENWALITFNYDNGYGKDDYAAFVNRRFLTKKKPEARSSSKTAAAKKEPAASEDPLEAMNREFKSAKNVAPYTVTVRPTRASGWVNLRWAPSDSAELMATFKANDKLTVIKELDSWLQVEDPETGNVGFINRDFIAE